jgi:hypothetical protein
MKWIEKIRQMGVGQFAHWASLIPCDKCPIGRRCSIHLIKNKDSFQDTKFCIETWIEWLNKEV